MQVKVNFFWNTHPGERVLCDGCFYIHFEYFPGSAVLDLDDKIILPTNTGTVTGKVVGAQGGDGVYTNDRDPTPLYTWFSLATFEVEVLGDAVIKLNEGDFLDVILAKGEEPS